MRFKKKAVALLIMLTMIITLFGGCRGSDGQKKANGESSSGDDGQKTEAVTGRFFENEVSLPKGIRNIKALRKLSDGSLEAVAEKKEDESYYLLKSANEGKKWNTTRITGLEKQYMPYAAIAPDGTAAMFSYAKEGKVSVNVADVKGKSTKFSFSFPEKSVGKTENQVRQAAYDNEGKLIVMDMEGVLFTVASDGKCSKLFDTEGVGVNYFSIAGDILLAVNDEGIVLFNTKEGKMLEREDTLDDLLIQNKRLISSDTDSGQPMVFSDGTEENSVIFANEDGIFHFTMGGSVIEQLLDGSLMSLGNGEIILQDLAVLSKDNIFIATNSGSGAAIYHYSYEKNAVAAPAKELTVYALDESSYLRKAVSIFQKKNPDIHVNLEFGLSGEDGITLEDALSVLNTNILAGKGPDVLVLDGMPMESYTTKGMLEDISDVVEEVDKQDGILQNIRDGSTHDGKIYAMPARFLFLVAEGDKATVKSGGSLAALAKRAKELKKGDSSANVIPNKGTRTLLRDLYYADSAVWQKDDGTLDRDTLMEYLKYAKQIYDVDSGSKDNDNVDKLVGDGTLSGIKTGTHQNAGLISKQWQISFGSLSGFFELQTMCSAWPQTKTDYCLLNHEKVKSYIPYLSMGVTAGGNIEMAKEFVKTVLGKNAENDESNGFPVNRGAFEELCKEKMDAQNVKDDSSVAFGGNEGDDKVYGFEYINLTQADVDKFTEITQSLAKPSMTDRVIQELVLEQGDKYLLGEQNLENTVDAILKKVNLYLAE